MSKNFDFPGYADNDCHHEECCLDGRCHPEKDCGEECINDYDCSNSDCCTDSGRCRKTILKMIDRLPHEKKLFLRRYEIFQNRLTFPGTFGIDQILVTSCSQESCGTM